MSTGIDEGFDEVGSLVEAADIPKVGSGDPAFFAVALALVAAGALSGTVVIEESPALVQVAAGHRDRIDREGITGVEV